MKCKLLSLLFLTFCLSVDAQDADEVTVSVDALTWLEGTWKVEGQEVYETWRQADAGELVGEGYQLSNGDRKHLESLEILESDGQVIYKATVSNQNFGTAISFPCEGYSPEDLIFVNREHDFPNKIQYTRVGDDKILIRLFGLDGGVFIQRMAYHLIRQ